MLPPEAIRDNKRRARYHFILAIDDIVVQESSAVEGLDTCRVTGRVERVYRKPFFHLRPAKQAPRKGQPFSVSVRCWQAARHPEPPGGNRLHHGGPGTCGWIEVWGSIVENELMVFEFEEFDQ